MKSSKKSSAKSTKSLHRHWSAGLVDEPSRAQSRAMLHAVGFERGDFRKSQIGVASTWSQVTPCNIHIDKLAIASAEGTAKAGSKALIFNTITISDGISMGTQGMKYSLVSREVIADSIETVMGCEMLDGLVAIGGCDKNMPGCLIAIARLNRPCGVRLRRHDFARLFPEPRRGYRVGFRGGGRARGGQDERSATWPRWSNARFPAPVPAAACTPRTPWRARSRRWA